MTSAARFATPERRRILQLSFPDRATAAAAAARLANGVDFETLLAERDLSVADVDLGFVSAADVLDSAVAEAAFALADGETSGLVEGRVAPVVLKVAGVAAASRTPYEEVADLLKREIAEREARRQLTELYNEIEDARAGGATLTEVADRFSLALRDTPPLDRQGRAADGVAPDLPSASRLLGEAFDTDVGMENPVLTLGQGGGRSETGFLWFEVAAIVSTRERTLDEARGDVAAAWQEERRAEARIERLDTLEARLQAGASLAELADELGGAVVDIGDFTRADPAPILAGAGVDAAFSGPVGTTARTRTAAGEDILLVVTSVTAPSPLSEPARQQLADTLSDALALSLVSGYVLARQETLGITVNEAAIGRVLGISERAVRDG